MPKIYEAKTLEAAYELASSSLDCSVVDLHIEIIQYPSKGFLGLFSKKAIIKAKAKSKKEYRESSTDKNNDVHIESLSSKLNDIDTSSKENHKKTVEQTNKNESIFDDFYSSRLDDKVLHSNPKIKKNKETLEEEIEDKINELFSHICYKIDRIKVEILDEQTVYVEFSGEDSALLIGKEGYRYKALSYILFNWINEKYGMMLRLEVAQFLKNQEESVHNYLVPVIETIKEEGYFKTKPLDGILVHIALTKLRTEFPNKYVAVKTNQNGEKYILVNEYKN